MANDLEGWLIAIVGPLTLVGAPERGTRVLSPVYELKAQIAQTREGLAMGHACFPVLLFASLDSITLPDDAVIVDVGSLSRADRKSIAEAVRGVKDLVRKMTAAQSGIVIADGTAKLPPIRGVT